MGKRFSDAFLADLTNQVDLVGLIGKTVELRKQGNEFTACCPFHTEKSPSFTVSPNKGFFHCFGCKEHGNAFDFVMRRDNCSFPEAVRIVADFAGVALPEIERDGENHDKDREAVKMLNVLAGFYEEALTKNSALLQELKDLWGLSDDIIRDLRLGYAPKRYRLPHGSDEAHKRANIVDTRNGGPKVFDKLIVPLVNNKGTVLGFSAIPTPSSGERREVKMGIETAAHHCFGFERLRKELAGSVADHVFVVPRAGEMLRAIAQGLPAVAPAGAALSEPQAIKLVRHAKNVVAAFPGNAVGRQLALEVALKIAGMRTTAGHGTVRVLFAPPGEDFSSFAKVLNPDRVGRMAATTPAALDFLMDEIGARFDLSTREGRDACWQRGVQVLDCFQAGDFGHLVVSNELQRSLTVPYSDAMRYIHNQTLETVAESLTVDEWRAEEPGRRAIRAMLAQPDLAPSEDMQKLIDSSSTPARQCAQAMREYLMKGGAAAEGAFDGNDPVQTVLRIMRSELAAATTYAPEEILRPFAEISRHDNVDGALAGSDVAPSEAAATRAAGTSTEDAQKSEFDLPAKLPRKHQGRFFQRAKIR